MRRKGNRFNKVVRNLSMVSIVLFLTGSSWGATWNGITPMISTMADVAKIMGPCTERIPGPACIYRVQSRIVLLTFTEGEPCSSTNRLWPVPDGTVTYIFVYIDRKTQMPVSVSGYDLSSFRESDSPDLPGWQFYSKGDEGFALVVESGLLKEEHFFPRKEDLKGMFCPTQ